MSILLLGISYRIAIIRCLSLRGHRASQCTRMKNTGAQHPTLMTEKETDCAAVLPGLGQMMCVHRQHPHDICRERVDFCKVYSA